MTDRQAGLDWLTKQQVADKFGKSLAFVTRLTTKGVLNPVSVRPDDGGVPQNRYDPLEVAEAMADPKLVAQGQSSLDQAKEDLALYQLDTVRAVIGLIREPREKIDALQFEIIAGLRARVKDLEAEVDAGRKAIAAALDQSAERAIAIEMTKNDQAIKKLATERVLNTIGKLISGPDGLKFTPEQLEELVLANGDGEEQFLTPEQVKQAKEIIGKNHAAKNGKATVAAVKKTVVDAAGVTSND
jgi:hypothetical protein